MNSIFTKLFLCTTILFSYNFNAKAQTAISKGNVIVDLYYGYPNLGNFLINAITSEIDGEVTTNAVGPLGLRTEYMVADNFGLGVDFIYNSASGTGSIDSLNSDGTIHSTYDATGIGRRFRLHVRANYHFVHEDNFDAYVGFGAGTNNRVFGFKSDFPNYDGASTAFTILPVSARLALGSRFYFNENIGLNLELGIGGPILSAGLSIKF